MDAIAAIFDEIGVTQSDFFIFRSEENGLLALLGVLGTPNNQALTIAELIHQYAPWMDRNNPVAYANSIARITGITPTTLLSGLTGQQLFQLAGAIQRVEGTRVGTTTYRNA